MYINKNFSHLEIY